MELLVANRSAPPSLAPDAGAAATMTPPRVRRRRAREVGSAAAREVEGAAAVESIAGVG
jgi:hypothetical protein